MAESGFKPRQFASQISVLNSHVLPSCLLRLGRETVLTPNFTSLLVAFYEDQSVVLIRDNHLLRHMLGDYSMSGTRSDHEDTVEGKWFSYPIPVGCK